MNPRQRYRAYKVCSECIIDVYSVGNAVEKRWYSQTLDILKLEHKQEKLNLLSDND